MIEEKKYKLFIRANQDNIRRANYHRALKRYFYYKMIKKTLRTKNCFSSPFTNINIVLKIRLHLTECSICICIPKIHVIHLTWWTRGRLY